jgi:hypothetical protein
MTLPGRAAATAPSACPIARQRYPRATGFAGRTCRPPPGLGPGPGGLSEEKPARYLAAAVDTDGAFVRRRPSISNGRRPFQGLKGVTPLVFGTGFEPVTPAFWGRTKIKSHFIHHGFRSSSPDTEVAKSSKELTIPPVLPPPYRTNLTQIGAPKMRFYFCAAPVQCSTR